MVVAAAGTTDRSWLVAPRSLVWWPPDPGMWPETTTAPTTSQTTGVAAAIQSARLIFDYPDLPENN